jgi:hypothetical protein
VNIPNTRTASGQRFFIPALLLVALVGIGMGMFLQTWLHNRRVAEIAAQGRSVMPFDLNATTHTFQALDDGGLQTVTTDDPGDTEQIALIRAHVKHEAAQFQQGNFNDPARLHGGDMPGLAELSAGASRIDFQYDELPAGAQIRYTTKDATLIDALHRWFAAQISDHDKHAMPNMQH